jgi:hypothetical protein
MIKGEVSLIHANLCLLCPFDEDLLATTGRHASKHPDSAWVYI